MCRRRRTGSAFPIRPGKANPYLAQKTVLLAALLLLLVAPVALVAKVQKPCRGGKYLGTSHAYSECRVNKAKKKVWYVVTDDDYSCPPKGATRKFRTSEKETAQPCSKPTPSVAANLQELKPSDYLPKPNGEIVVMECRDQNPKTGKGGTWYRVTYQRYTLPPPPPGRVRFSKPAKKLVNTGVECKKAPPAARKTGTSAVSTGDKRVSGLPASEQPATLSGVMVATREDRQAKPSLLLTMSGGISGLVVGEVRAELPPRTAKQVSAETLPTDWQMERDGGLLIYETVGATALVGTANVDFSNRSSPLRKRHRCKKIAADSLGP